MRTDQLLQNKTAVPNEFDRVARRYDLATGMSHGYGEDLQKSARLLDLKGNENVLDLCCGTGKSSSAILPYLTTGKLTCVDNSAEMLGVAAEKFGHLIKTGKVAVSKQDAMHLDFAENTFDAVFIAYGLRNMPDYSKFLEGIQRIIKPGGKLVIHDYSLSENWYSKPMWFILGYFFIVPFCTLVTGSPKIFTYLVKSVLTFLNPGEIKALLEKTGFENVSIHNHANWRKPILHSFRANKGGLFDL